MARPGEYLAFDGPAVIEAQIARPRDDSDSAARRDAHVRSDRVTRCASTWGTNRARTRCRGPSSQRSNRRRSLGRHQSDLRWPARDPCARRRRGPRRAPALERSGIATASWRAEASRGSTSALRQAALDDGTPALEWQFALAAGARGHAVRRDAISDRQRAVRPRSPAAPRAQRPAAPRLGAAARPGANGGERWGKTFFVHDSLAPIELRFDDFRPLGVTATERPPLARVDSLLLVVDTLNTSPGASGRIWIPDLWLAR